MKILPTLALGVAAALAALGPARAGQRALKAAPIRGTAKCSHYGPGFRAVRGSGVCVKVGGWVRAEASSGGRGAVNWAALKAGADDRASNDVAVPFRGDITTDIRKPTGYGTVRAYLSVGVNGQ
jgi:hypothetical protein